MTVETARQVLLDFIERSVEHRHGCVRIVHGKGLRSRDLPQLKVMTNRVLFRHPRVVAYASCRPVDGGTGATLALLKAPKGVRK
jgi:DNA-nicking Smr family endonuclease